MLEGEIIKVKDAALLVDGSAEQLRLFRHVLPRRLQHPNRVTNVISLLHTGEQPPHITPAVGYYPHCKDTGKECPHHRHVNAVIVTLAGKIVYYNSSNSTNSKRCLVQK